MPENKPAYDQKIMGELLEQPGIRENVEQMSPETLNWYKELLASEGIYAQYLKEHNR